MLATFHVFNSHMGLMATILASADVAHFHHLWTFYYTALL